MRDRLEHALLQLDGARVNGSRSHRLPGTTNMSFAGVDGAALLATLAREVALSSGSACTSAVPEPSYVLKAMGVEDELAYASLRMGLGRFTTEEEIEFAIEKIGAAVSRLQQKDAASEA
jgi:cysteine desulfurase